MNWHEAANIFPLDEEHIDELAEDIKANGLLVPIEMLDGQILDGRRRSMACERAGVEPDCVEVDPDDPVAYVVSLNSFRRHMTPSQLSMVGARIRDIYAKQAKERQRLSKGRGKKGPVNLPDLKSDARDAAGKAVGISGSTVDHATAVIKNGVPELADAVDAGDVAVSLAAKVAELPKAEQRKAVAGGKAAMREAVKPPVGKKLKPLFPVSDEYTKWLSSIMGWAGEIEQNYGGMKKLISHKQWQKKETANITAIMDDLIRTLSKMKKELNDD